MQEANYHKDNLKVLGRLFKDYREQSGFSVRGISRSINISHAVISEIENCKIHPNLETLKELYGTIGIKLCTDADFLDQQSARIEELYDTLYYMEYEKARLLLEKLRKNDERLRHSPLRIDYLLADKLGSVMLDRQSADVDFHILSEEVDHMSREQRLIYRLGHGVKLFYALDYKTAVEWFEMNLGNNSKDKMYVLNTYYLSHAYHKVFRNYLSIRYADETAEALNRHNNIKRRLEIDILKAQKHIDNGAYDSAKNLLLSLENALRIQYNDETARKRFSVFKAYIAYAERDFQAVLRHIDTSGEQTPTQYFIKLLAHYKLGDNESARQALKGMEPYFENEPENQYVLLGMLFKRLLGMEISDEVIDSISQKILNRPYRFVTVHLFYMAFDLMLYHYEQKEDIEKCYEITRTLNRISKERDTHETNLMR